MLVFLPRLLVSVLIGEAERAAQQIYQCGLEYSGQQNDRDRSSDNHDCQRPLSLSAYASGQRGGKEAQPIDQGGHHHGPKAAIGAHDDRVHGRMSLLPEFVDVEIEQDGVHDRDREDRDETHRGGDAEWCVSYCERHYTAETREWNLRHENERINHR